LYGAIGLPRENSLSRFSTAFRSSFSSWAIFSFSDVRYGFQRPFPPLL
uniref:Ovule protein n=1 Tax=Brugia timori TaxID=42155 RepID=A0A0R3QAD3_9BILA